MLLARPATSIRDAGKGYLLPLPIAVLAEGGTGVNAIAPVPPNGGAPTMVLGVANLFTALCGIA